MQTQAQLFQTDTATAPPQASHALTDRDSGSAHAQQPKDMPCPGHAELSGHVQCPAHVSRADTDAAVHTDSQALLAIVHAYGSSPSEGSSAPEDRFPAAESNAQPEQQHATDVMQQDIACDLQCAACTSNDAVVDSSAPAPSLALHAPSDQPNAELMQQQLAGVTQPSAQPILPHVAGMDASSQGPVTLHPAETLPAEPELAAGLGLSALPSPSAAPDASADQLIAQSAALPAKDVPAASAAGQPSSMPAAAFVADVPSATVPQQGDSPTTATTHQIHRLPHAAPHDDLSSYSAGPAAGDLSVAAAFHSGESPAHATASPTSLHAAVASTDQRPTAVLPAITTSSLHNAPASGEVPAAVSPSQQTASAAAASMHQQTLPAVPSASGAALDPPVPQADSNGSFRQTHRRKPDKRKREAASVAAAVEPSAQRRKPGRQKVAAAVTPEDAEPGSQAAAEVGAQPVRRSSRHCAGTTVASKAAAGAQAQGQLRTKSKACACKVRATCACVHVTVDLAMVGQAAPAKDAYQQAALIQKLEDVFVNGAVSACECAIENSEN